MPNQKSVRGREELPVNILMPGAHIERQKAAAGMDMQRNGY